MDPAIDTERLSAAVRKILDPGAPGPMRQMAAKGVAPGLKPNEALTVVTVLSESDDAPIATAAKATLANLPAPLLSGALAGELPPGVLGLLAPLYARNLGVMEKILTHPSIMPEAVAIAASMANEAVAELIATNEQRLLAHPEIIEKLYMNKDARMSTADRILELAVRNKIELKGIPAYKEAAAAIAQELITEPSLEPTPDDILFKETERVARQTPIDPATEDTHRVDEQTGEEVVDDRFLPLHIRVAKLTNSQKIRLAMVGSAGERLILVRDSNRLVSSAAIKSPSIQEDEVVRISSSRTVSDDVLRIIAMDKEWTRSHQIKLNLVQNPRTPFVFSAKLVTYLRENELKQLARSKNVSGAIAQAARQQLNRRNVPT